MSKTIPCRGCGAPIMFITMSTGKKMPVDPEPVDVFDGSSPGPFVSEYGFVKKADEIEHDDGENFYISHFATCSEAKEFRRPRESNRFGDINRNRSRY